MAAIECWAFIDDGKIILHQENDGAGFLRHGAEATQRVISLGELACRYPSVSESLIKSKKRVSSKS
jgi:hypothetical protein